MRVVTYNIHSCIGLDGKPNPAAIVEVLKELNGDIVALQEVPDHRHADKSFLKALDRLGYPHVIYGPTLLKAQGRFGNVLLCRFPTDTIQRVDLSVGGKEPRGAIHVRSQHHGFGLNIIATHLGLNSIERVQQIRILLKSLVSSQTRMDPSSTVALLMGDFNEWFPFSCCK